jgi:hypothetical protein
MYLFDAESGVELLFEKKSAAEYAIRSMKFLQLETI